jgi:hypothetical protein
MAPYLAVILGILSTSVVYYVVASILAARYHARRARELGCQPAFERPYRLPLALDRTWEIFQADRENVVPSYLHDIYKDVRRPTWEQNFLGTKAYVTTDPKNIQAVLATQFNDFEIGGTRRGNFLPMLGNGIFTSDGKAW